jgi:hypothetical protein
MSPKMLLMLPTPKRMTLQTQGKMQELNLHRCKLTALKVVNINV